jgi:hypothetical protein
VISGLLACHNNGFQRLLWPKVPSTDIMQSIIYCILQQNKPAQGFHAYDSHIQRQKMFLLRDIPLEPSINQRLKLKTLLSLSEGLMELPNI